MAFAVISGRKVCTTRNDKYGGPGDTFDVTNGAIRARCTLTNVEQRKLGFVASFLYVAEGFDTVREFIDVWNKLHPRKGFIDDQDSKKWVHWLEVTSYHVIPESPGE